LAGQAAAASMTGVSPQMRARVDRTFFSMRAINSPLAAFKVAVCGLEPFAGEDLGRVSHESGLSVVMGEMGWLLKFVLRIGAASRKVYPSEGEIRLHAV
jgi:hypothetical protein